MLNPERAFRLTGGIKHAVADANYSAYVPGCVATGDTLAAVEREKNWLDC